LLRVHRERPHEKRAAEHGDKLSLFDYDCHLLAPHGGTPTGMWETIARLEPVVCDVLHRPPRDAAIG
jgi:hypothetical protein